MSDSWKKVVLEDVAAPAPNSLVDGPFGSNLKTSDYTDEGIRLIQLQNIGEGEWIDSNRKFTSESKYRELSRHSVRPGDIAIAKMADPVARACLVPPVSDRFIVVADCIKLTPNTFEFDPRYVVYAINHPDFRSQAVAASTGTTRQRINLTTLKSLSLTVPSLTEQRRIAEILDTVDAAIQQTEAVIAKLKQIKTGLLHDLLTRGIDEHGQLRDPSAHPEQFKDSPLGRIPREWALDVLDSLATKITDGTHQAVSTVSGSGDTVPFVYVSCIRDGRIYWDQAAHVSRTTYEDIARGREPVAGAVLYTTVGSFGHAALIRDDREFAFQRHVAYIRANPDRINSLFLIHWLNAPRSRAHADQVAVGNAQKTVTLAALAKFPVPVPSNREQDLISQLLDEEDSRIDLEQQYAEKLRLIRRGLMDDLLAGRRLVSTIHLGQDSLIL